MIDPGLQSAPILQSALAEVPWQNRATAKLPGTGPVEPGDWLRIDDAYAGQMELRARLLRRCRDKVHVLRAQAVEAARELLSEVLEVLKTRDDFDVSARRVVRPDGEQIDIDPEAPLITLAHLVQEDFCILQRRDGEDEHALTGALLCFPASWTLAEKIDRPLTAIHDTVAPYTDDIARRVQRLFDGVRPGRTLWRVNLLRYRDADLFQPRPVADRRRNPAGMGHFIRSERQCISRLPRTGAMVFSIHTTVVRSDALSEDMCRDMLDYLANMPAD